MNPVRDTVRICLWSLPIASLEHETMPRLRHCLLFALLIFPGVLAAQSDDLLTHIWDGVQQAQEKYKSGCGNGDRDANLEVDGASNGAARQVLCRGIDEVHAGIL